jgi:hypothetical protein
MTVSNPMYGITQGTEKGEIEANNGGYDNVECGGSLMCLLCRMF